MFGNESYIFRTLLKWSNNIISTAFLPGLLSASCSDQSHGHNNRFTYRVNMKSISSKAVGMS